ncbi:LuxR C-terminal-related transcriptional regulator [Streptomyces sp. PT12]|uniref:LuxR C-terminal-related transcriptional regulator n=1 Tax=Streptomyces sp. PT12 TaxID=1510197 RepID=UPI0015EEEDFE|nr:LuxR C-terminal-related transcriptional regulator [Streptomyces sp. PT12]
MTAYSPTESHDDTTLTRPRSGPSTREGGRLVALAELSSALPESADLEQLQETYFALAPRVLDFPMAALYLFDSPGGAPSWYASRNVSQRFMSTYERLGRPVDMELRELLATASPVYNLANRSLRQWRQTEIYQRVVRLENMIHVLKAPVMAHGEIIGTVDFASDRVAATVTEFDLHLARLLAGCVAGAVQAVRRREWLEKSLDITSTALRHSGVAIVCFRADSNEPVVTPAAAELLDSVWEGQDLLYRLLRDVESGSGETRLSYMVRRDDGTRDVLDCAITRVPDQPGTEIMRLSLESTETPYLSPALGTLSARETDIAEMVAAGLSDREIAELLTLSVYTVRQHIKSVYAKLDIGNRVQLTRVLLGRTPRVVISRTRPDPAPRTGPSWRGVEEGAGRSSA